MGRARKIDGLIEDAGFKADVLNANMRFTDLVEKWSGAYSATVIWKAQKAVAASVGASRGSLGNQMALMPSDLERVVVERKERNVNWRELCSAATAMQKACKTASMSNDFVTWAVPDAEGPIG